MTQPAPKPKIPPDPDATKVCPYCAETIKAAATVCRFCQRSLVAPARTPVPAKKAGPLGFILITLAVCGGLWWFVASPIPGQASCPPAGATAGTIVGYDTSAGHKSTITAWAVYGQPGAAQVAVLNEGDPVWVLNRQADGGVQITTRTCRVQGWVDSEFVR